MDIKQAIAPAEQKLKKAKIPNPRLDAEILLSHILQKPREYLLTYPEKKLTRLQLTGFQALIKRRGQNEPLDYLTGHKEFYGYDFLVNKNTLIPRPETELMIDEALRLFGFRKPIKGLRNPDNPTTVIDIGTGSGCIIISLVKQLNQKAKIKNKKYLAIDISQPALTLARKNALKHGVKKQIKFCHGNLLELITKNKLTLLNSNFLILANLPYLTPDQIKNSPTIQYEPKLALTAGPDGLKYYRQLLSQIAKLRQNNRPSGHILCEIDPGQTKKIKQLIKNKLPLAKIAIKKDLKGHNRLVVIKL